jgi:hypothetical protein
MSCQKHHLLIVSAGSTDRLLAFSYRMYPFFAVYAYHHPDAWNKCKSGNDDHLPDKFISAS